MIRQRRPRPSYAHSVCCKSSAIVPANVLHVLPPRDYRDFDWFGRRTRGAATGRCRKNGIDNIKGLGQDDQRSSRWRPLRGRYALCDRGTRAGAPRGTGYGGYRVVARRCHRERVGPHDGDRGGAQDEVSTAIASLFDKYGENSRIWAPKRRRFIHSSSARWTLAPGPTRSRTRMPSVSLSGPRTKHSPRRRPPTPRRCSALTGRL